MRFSKKDAASRSAVFNSSVHSYCTFEQSLPGLSVTRTRVRASHMILRLYHRARQAKWAGQHFRAIQHAEPTPRGSCRSSRQHAVIPVSLFLVRHICYTACFFFFLLVSDTYLLFISYTCHPLPATAALPGRSGPLNWCLPAAEIVSPSQAGATQTLHPHE